VANIKAPVILECANLPVTTDAEAVLEQQGCVILPDILTNAGGVTVSYFEWVQNLQQFHWTEEEVNQRLEGKMLSAFKRVYTQVKERNLTYRESCYRIAVARVCQASQLRGYI
jgi:glutamate dehydrogenase/leucine dehydrogenase